MEISFQHLNPKASHDSTLLSVSPRGEESRRYLIDAGPSVSPSASLGSEESLDGVFLTHAHSDHYASLGPALASTPGTPLYTSPPTATMLEQVYAEADRYQDLGDVDAITEALTPIETWTTLADGIYVLPIPAGHTPGAAAFLFRIDDLQYNDETVTVLATGDFTTRPVAGYSGLTVPQSIDIDVLIANAATSDAFQEQLSDAAETILERALSGATTLVAASALTGVHLAYVLGHLTDRLDRALPINLVGQAAKHYTALDYDIPSVRVYPHFDQTDEVLGPGTVTIAGPEAPTQGSIKRLFGVVKDDPDAVFVQVTTSSPEIIDGVACATHHFEVSNHPTENQFLEFVETHLPRHLVFKHVGIETSKSIESSFESLFHWGNDDMRSHILYDDGTWAAPDWVSDSGANLIRQRNYRKSDTRIPIDQPIEKLPTVSWEQQSVSLEAEGVAVDTLVDKFESTQPSHTPGQEVATSDGGTESPATDTTEGVDKQDATAEPIAAHDDQRVAVDQKFQAEILERIEAIESSLDDLASESLIEETVEAGFETVESRLNTVETAVEDLPAQLERDPSDTVTGTVVRQNDLILLRLDPDEVADVEQSLDHEAQLEVAIRSSDAPGPE